MVQFVGYNIIRPHQVLILMLQQAGMENVAARVTIESHDDREHLSRADYCRVLPSSLVCGWDAWRPHEHQGAVAKSHGVESLATQNLKLGRVQMHRMCIVGRVDKSPFLDGSQFHNFRNWIVVSLAID